MGKQPKDQNSKSPKKDKYSLRSKRRDNMKKKKNDESSESDETYSESQYESDEELDKIQYKKFLSKLFPSKFMNDKIREIEENNDSETNSKSDDESLDESNNEKKTHKTKRYKKLSLRNKKKKNKLIVDESSSEENNSKLIKKNTSKNIETSSTESSDDDYDDYDNEYTNDQNINIVFTLADPKSYYQDEEDSYSETEDDSMSSSTSSDSEKETEKKIEDTDNKDIDKQIDEEIDELTGLIDDLKQEIKEENHKLAGNTDKKTRETKKVDDKQILGKFIKDVKAMKEFYDNDILDELIETGKEKYKNLKKKQEKRDKKIKSKNLTRFRKGITEKNVLNDYAYFNKLSLEEQTKLLNELDIISNQVKHDKPYRVSLLESNIPAKFKAAALKKINALRYMEPGAGEYYKSKNWVDTFMHIPFNSYKELPINKSDGIEKCHDFMENAKQVLDSAVYGLNDAKLQIMQLVGQWITNPKAVGTSIAIKGPMGTGKTTLVKEGISKILNREFTFIALGGATDSSFLEGHSYTYEGSTWGRIVDILIQSQCMNPIIYFDELDKISDTPKGEEIAGILTHLTDSAQNTQFHDKYFSEIDFDLSKCLFIFSYNDESKINPILRDRMYRIQTKGYDKKQKTIIARNYLLKTIRDMVKFTEEEIIISDETLHYIIDNFTDQEDGVRNLKRCLEIIYTKLNLYRLMKPDTNLFEEDLSLNVTFPFDVTNNIIDKLLKSTDSKSHLSMYM